MGRKPTTVSYIDDDKKRKTYYNARFKNQLKKLTAGSIIAGYDFYLTVINHDENEIYTCSNLNNPGFDNEKKKCEKSGFRKKMDVFNEENYHTAFLETETKEKKTKDTPNGTKNGVGQKRKREVYSEEDDDDGFIIEEKYEEPRKKTYTYITNPIDLINKNVSHINMTWNRFDAN